MLQGISHVCAVHEDVGLAHVGIFIRVHVERRVEYSKGYNIDSYKG